MRTSAPSCLANALRGLSLSSSTAARPSILAAKITQQRAAQHARPFSATTSMASWLEPRIDRTKKMMKGRVRVATGGSTKGTTVIWGQYGLRMTDHGRRISATQLKVAEDTIKARLRGQKYRLYKRVNCNLGVFVSGNEVSSVLKQALLQFVVDVGTNKIHPYRFVWVKERAHSTIGLLEWL